MKQSYHSNAVTNVQIRNLLRNSKLSVKKLSNIYDISEKTVKKWQNREQLTDKSSRPDNISYSLTELDQLIVINLRSITWWSLDEITEAIAPDNPYSVRSAVYRTFVREGINTVPKKEKEKAKKFKEYDPGYLHIDVTYLPKINGVKYYLFVAIDRATRTIYFEIYDAKTSDNAVDFLAKCIDFFPVYISHTLTDNGLEFTNRLLKSKKGQPSNKLSKFDVACNKNDIVHRCTKPFTPKTNGMVEKANDIIKNATIKKIKYNSIDQMREDLTKFLVHYNLYRRHGSLRRELKVKTPFDAIEKWYELDPTIFKQKPSSFKEKTLNLNHKFNQDYTEQPCET